MLICVDASLVASADTCATNETWKFLESVYQKTNFGWPKDFLGFELDFGTDAENNRYCVMQPTRHFEEILNRYSIAGRPVFFIYRRI